MISVQSWLQVGPFVIPAIPGASEIRSSPSSQLTLLSVPTCTFSHSIGFFLSCGRSTTTVVCHTEKNILKSVIAQNPRRLWSSLASVFFFLEHAAKNFPRFRGTTLFTETLVETVCYFVHSFRRETLQHFRQKAIGRAIGFVLEHFPSSPQNLVHSDRFLTLAGLHNDPPLSVGQSLSS